MISITAYHSGRIFPLGITDFPASMCIYTEEDMRQSILQKDVRNLDSKYFCLIKKWDAPLVPSYISSLSGYGSFFAAKIRGNWSIENQLHWVKDVLFAEDDWPRSQFQAATNVSVLRTMALNLFRFLGFFSVTDAYKCLGKRVERYLFLLE